MIAVPAAGIAIRNPEQTKGAVLSAAIEEPRAHVIDVIFGSLRPRGGNDG